MSGRSQRYQFMTRLKELASRIRNARYWVRRGAVDWASFDFSARKHAIALTVDEGPVLPDVEGRQTFKIGMELFGAMPGDSTESIDDLLMDELWEDAGQLLEQLIQESDERGDSLALKLVASSTKGIETHDAGLQVEGLIVTFTVSV